MNLMMISAFILYFIILTAIGFYFYQKNQTAEGFMVGDRSVNYWVTAIATQTSDMGSWLFLGFPAVMFAAGVFEFWVAIGLICGMFSTWKLIAPKLREKTANLDSLTLSSYLSHSFNDTSGAIQFMTATFGLLFFIFYIASGLVGLSLVFSAAFDISYKTGIVLSLVTAAGYTLIGGFVAIAWCDFFQGIFLLAMIILVPSYAFYTIGSIDPILTAAHAQGISLTLLPSFSKTISAIFLAASWGLGYFGQPHILVNFMGIDNPDNIKYAQRIGMIWQILVLVAAAAVGIVGIGFFNGVLPNSQLVFIEMTTQLFNPFFAGLILCAILAATLSTVDSLILVAGSTIAQDIYKRFINPHASSDLILWISRVSAITVSCIALALAWSNNSSVYNLVNYAWSGLGSTFGPLVIASIYSKNITYQGALAGLIMGGITSGLWPLFSTLLPLVPGFTANMITLYVVSYITRSK